MWSFSYKTDERISYQELEKMNMDDFLQKLQTIVWLNALCMTIDFKISCLGLQFVLVYN